MNYTSATGSSASEPHHGGKAPGHHHRVTNHGYHQQNGGANGPNGCSRKNHRMGRTPLISHTCTTQASPRQRSLPPSRSINRIPSIKVSRQHQPPWKYSPSKKKRKEFDLQEVVTNIGVQRIIDSVEEQFIEDLNEEYFGYANNTIKSILHHL